MTQKNLHVLLADDDMDDCNFFKRALDELSLNTQLSVVNDGEELMAFLFANLQALPVVLFLDINMPRKNGMECLFEIRQHAQLRALPVVMFSTSNTWDTIDKLFKSGAHVYIHKPNDFGQLKQVIQHAIPIALDKMFPNSPVKYVLNAPDKG